MREWLTYELSDLLLFSERVYWRLFVLENAALWPAPLIAPLLMLVAIALHARTRRHDPSTIAALLAFAWASVGWHFIWLRYAPVNWAMPYVAPVFAIQAALFACLALRPQNETGPGRLQILAGYVFLLFATIIHPLLAGLFQRPIAGAEIIGIAPDPTATASLGAAFLMPAGWCARITSLVSLLWLAQSALTLFVLNDAGAFVPGMIAVLALAALGATRAKSVCG